MDKRTEFNEMKTVFDAALPKECGNCASTDNLMIHHIVPLNAGGNNVLANIVRLCAECHAAAHNGNDFVAASARKRKERYAAGKDSIRRPMLGYDCVNNEMVVNEEEAEIVRYIFRLRYEYECGTAEIAKILTFMEIPTVRGAERWVHAVIIRILSNRIYFGELIREGVNYGNVIPAILGDEMNTLINAFEQKHEGLPKRKQFKRRTYLSSADAREAV